MSGDEEMGCLNCGDARSPVTLWKAHLVLERSSNELCVVFLRFWTAMPISFQLICQGSAVKTKYAK